MGEGLSLTGPTIRGKWSDVRRRLIWRERDEGDGGGIDIEADKGTVSVGGG